MMLKIAMANRNSAETLVPIDPADLLDRIEARRERRGGERDADRHQHHDGRVTEREEEADADWTLALLHQLAGDVVDRGDMIGVDRVAQAERIGQQRRAQVGPAAHPRPRAPRARRECCRRSGRRRRRTNGGADQRRFPSGFSRYSSAPHPRMRWRRTTARSRADAAKETNHRSPRPRSAARSDGRSPGSRAQRRTPIFPVAQ